MSVSIVAVNGISILRYENIDTDFGNIQNLEISSRDNTPTLSYDFKAGIVRMSSGSYTSSLPALVETIKTLPHCENPAQALIDSGWIIQAIKES